MSYVIAAIVLDVMLLAFVAWWELRARPDLRKLIEYEERRLKEDRDGA